MDSYPEQLPITRENRQFPMGDVDPGRKAEMTDSWIKDISLYQPSRLSNYLNFSSKSAPMDGEVTNKNHQAALDLSVQWDINSGNNHKFATIGFMVVRAYLNETRLLPKFDADWTDELYMMRTKSSQEIRAFGQTAWQGMRASHDFVHEQYVKVLELARPRFNLDIDEFREYFISGMMLPYVMSAASRLDGYHRRANITGMKVGTTEELEAVEFSRIFVSEK